MPASRTHGGYAPIGDYAAIGDGRTIALVARDGAIDWLPLPTIAEPAAFAAILDAEDGGAFRLEVEGAAEVRRRYVDGTAVLVTTYETEHGTLEVTDALATRDGGLLPWVELVRRLRCTSGEATVRWCVDAAFGFGSEETRVEHRGDVRVAVGDRLRVAVRTWDAGDVTVHGREIGAETTLQDGETAFVVCIATDEEPVALPERDEVEARLMGTCDAWQRWCEQIEFDGEWSDVVRRSALTLKLLTYTPSGALAAAGTTGLPEKIGGSRNFDYRFCWIRDTSFALDVLSRLGLREETHASLSWLLSASRSTHPRLAPFFELSSGRVPRSVRELDVQGYRGSRPVRVGNSAASQLQLGNFGDLFGAIAHYVAHGNVLDPTSAQRLAETADFVCGVWRDDDAGLWELDKMRPYTSSKMSCWLALTRAVALADERRIPGERADAWRATAEEIRDYVETRCWSERHGSYSFYADSDDLDCAVLRASQFGFGDPRGERMNGTIDALRRELGAGDALVYRYSGQEGEEGCFLACSFWLVTALAHAGRLDEARTSFRELVELANDVGLYSEEIDPDTHELLGNFPQALTHLAVIQAAVAIADVERNGGSG